MPSVPAFLTPQSAFASWFLLTVCAAAVAGGAWGGVGLLARWMGGGRFIGGAAMAGTGRFRRRLRTASDAALRDGTGLVLLYVRLDGIGPGDLPDAGMRARLVAQAAHRIRAQTGDDRELDLARAGRSGLAVMTRLPAPTDDHGVADELARRLSDALAGPFVVDGAEISASVTIGIALLRPEDAADGDAGAAMIRNAVFARHRARQDRLGRMVTPRMASILRARGLEADLRDALHRDELTMQYQPLFDCQTNRLVAFEALARWHHPVRGIVPPEQFVRLAEETGLIQTLGAWALNRACAEAAGWSRPCRIAVNLSPAQLRNADLPAMVADTLHRTGLDPSRLEMEVTEGLLLEGTTLTASSLAALKAMGVRLALDDFGTGHASLSYLRQFPFDRIKIDRSFVNDIGTAPDAVAIISAMVRLGRRLRLEVTAEGVETTAQLAALRAHQCHEVQGFLLGRPLSSEDAARLLMAA